MQISEFLSADDCLVDVRAADKGALLRELARHAATVAGLDVPAIVGAIEKREQIGSTGMGGGIAIPHARIAGLARPVGVLARLRRGIDFAAIDGKDVDLVFLLLLPADARGESLPALAAVARRLRDAAVATRLRDAADRAALYQVITA